jgi:hypothetical protein
MSVPGKDDKIPQFQQPGSIGLQAQEALKILLGPPAVDDIISI